MCIKGVFGLLPEIEIGMDSIRGWYWIKYMITILFVWYKFEVWLSYIDGSIQQLKVP